MPTNALTTITVIPSQKRKHADLCKSQTPTGSRITVWREHNVCWVCHEGDLQIDFDEKEKASPFKSGRKHLKKVKKGQPTAQEETRLLFDKETFHYVGTVYKPDGTELWDDPDLEVDPTGGPKVPGVKKGAKYTAKK